MPEEGEGMYDDVPLHRLIVRDPVKQEVKMERVNLIPEFNSDEERKMIIIEDEPDIDNGLYTVYTRRRGARRSPVRIKTNLRRCHEGSTKKILVF